MKKPKRVRRKAEFEVGNVVRVIKNTTAGLRSQGESRAMRGDLLTLVEVQPLIGEWCFGRVRLRRDELRRLTATEIGPRRERGR